MLVIKSRRGLSGSKMTHLVEQVEACKYGRHKYSRIILPALESLRRVADCNRGSVDFFKDPLVSVKTCIKQCLFSELSDIWSRSCVASVTRLIHPTWQRRELPSIMHSRLSHVRYQCASLNRCPLRSRLFKINRCDTELCRYGCQLTEDLNHVLYICPSVSTERDYIKSLCRDYSFAFSTRNIFTRMKLQIPTEQLLLKFLNEA